MRRVLVWVSSGAASMVAARMVLASRRNDVELVRCETGNEDEDNYRFEADCEAWLGREITIIRSTEYADVPDVWERRKFMASPYGAPCTTHMKVEPRLAFQRPDDVHVFGYTADRLDAARFRSLQANYFELKVEAPLITAGITKAASLAMIENAGIRLPRSYAMGFPNANCLKTGCVKATSPDYWSLFRKTFPDRFTAQAERSRRIGARLVEIGGERRFLDELPVDWPILNPISPACDFLCSIAEMEMVGDTVQT